MTKKQAKDIIFKNVSFEYDQTGIKIFNSFNLKIEEGLRQEKNNFYKIIKSKNGIEGINAFIEKRKPKFCD